MGRAARERAAKQKFQTFIDAISYCNVAGVVEAIEAGADVNEYGMFKARKESPGSFVTPLASAVFTANAEILRLLIEAGAKVDQVDDDGLTPLCAATVLGNCDICRLLLESGADVNGGESLEVTDKVPRSITCCTCKLISALW